jgi:hypothetical protein
MGATPAWLVATTAPILMNHSSNIYILANSVADPDPVGSGRLGPDPDPGLNK